MKKIIILLILSLVISGCTSTSSPNTSDKHSTESHIADETPQFTSLNDPELINHISDSTYQELINNISDEGYFVENVETVYISKEYIDELNYNSQKNIFFGYTTDELDKQFEGTKYAFTLDDNGNTVVEEFAEYDDTYEKILKNVLVGSGVILICVTVTAVSSAAVPAMSVVFMTSAKAATTVALVDGLVSGITTGTITAIETGDPDEIFKASALAASDGFKWGAIAGALTGGLTSISSLRGATRSGLTLTEAAAIQKEARYPLDVIKQFNNMNQFNACKNAGLYTAKINNKTALIRDIDLDFKDINGLTNSQRIRQNLAPVDATGTPYELHHIGQNADSTLAILTKAEHTQNGNFNLWHTSKSSDVHDPTNKWNSQKIAFWKSYLEFKQPTSYYFPEKYLCIPTLLI